MSRDELNDLSLRAAGVQRMLLGLGVVVVFLAIHYSRSALLLLPAYRALFRAYDPAFPNLLWKATQIVLVLLAALAFAGGGVRGALRSLGLDRGVGRGLGWSFVGTLPALVGFALLGHLTDRPFTWFFLMTAVGSPLAEEMLYRGFLFRQLYEGARWSFWLAILVNALPFALAHLYQATDIGAGLPGTAGILLITGIGAAFGAWLFARWEWSLWPAVGFHAFLNAGAYLFAMGESVVSTPLAIPFLVATVLAMGGITIWRTGGWRVKRPGPSAVELAAAAIEAGD